MPLRDRKRTAATTQLWLRSYEDDEPLCTLGMCPENEWEDSRLGLLSGSMCKKKTQCVTSCCGQGVGKVLARVFTRKKFLVHQRVLKKSGLSQTESDETTPFSWSVRFCF